MGRHPRTDHGHAVLVLGRQRTLDIEHARCSNM
jgi:hypothetical protein